MNKISCCYNCENRTIGCHGSCESYKAERDARAEMRRSVNLGKLAQATLREGYAKRHEPYAAKRKTIALY